MRKWRHALIPKISLVLLGTAVLIFLIITIGYRVLVGDRNREALLQRHIDTYLDYIADDIGSPINEQKLSELEKRLSTKIMVTTPDGHTIGSSLPSPETLRGHRRGPAGSPIYFFRHDIFVMTDRNQNTYTLQVNANFVSPEILSEYFVVILIAIALVVVAAFFILRKIMQPVQLLNAGSLAFGQGHLEHRIHVASRDEFSDLAVAFNGMAENLQKHMASKEQLLLDVSHELRSPITRLKLALEMTDEFATKKSLQDDVLELEQLTSDLLDTYKGLNTKSDEEITEIQLVALINDCLATLNIDPSWVSLKIDAQLMFRSHYKDCKTIFKNIIENAAKYSDPKSQPILISAQSNQNHIVVTVRDFGIGVAADELQKITEPFYRTDKSRQRTNGGFGLGLSLAARLAERRGIALAFSTPEPAVYASTQTSSASGFQVTITLPT